MVGDKVTEKGWYSVHSGGRQLCAYTSLWRCEDQSTCGMAFKTCCAWLVIEAARNFDTGDLDIHHPNTVNWIQSINMRALQVLDSFTWMLFGFSCNWAPRWSDYAVHGAKMRDKWWAEKHRQLAMHAATAKSISYRPCSAAPRPANTAQYMSADLTLDNRCRQVSSEYRGRQPRSGYATTYLSSRPHDVLKNNSHGGLW